MEKSVHRGSPGQVNRNQTFDAHDKTFEPSDSNEDLLLKNNFWRRPDRSQSFKANQVSDSGISDSIGSRNRNTIPKKDNQSVVERGEVDSAELAKKLYRDNSKGLESQNSRGSH